MEQADVLAELGKIGAARRGQLSEQWYENTGKDGKVRRTGPYYVLSRCIGGEKSFVRVPRDKAASVREELERGKDVAVLIDKFWTNAEALAEKKTFLTTQRTQLGRNCAKPQHK